MSKPRVIDVPRVSLMIPHDEAGAVQADGLAPQIDKYRGFVYVGVQAFDLNDESWWNNDPPEDAPPFLRFV